MKAGLLRAAIGIIIVLVVVYVVDYAWLRVRVARGLEAFDTLQVETVDQVPQKGNKAEYIPEAPQNQTCVRSMFPHLGDQPCWYLRRHTQQQVNF
jgi:hypothetical protein